MNIDVNGVCFGYSDLEILKDLWVEFDGPQFISILGPNGVGKSTFINCICKILSSQKGVIRINGDNVEDLNVKQLSKELAYVPYAVHSSFPLTVADTVLMGRNPHSGMRTTDDDLRKVYGVLKRLGIEDLALRQFNELSAGQHQKVVLARGLVQEPNILLLDEPTANLDIKHQMNVSALLREISRERNMLIIMICHDINIAAKYSDNIVLMYKGSIHSVGTPEEVITSENLREVYGVDSTVIEANGRPHAILNHTLEDESDGQWEHPFTESNSPVLSWNPGQGESDER